VAIAERLSTIKHKILVLSGKGGVGKSTFAAQLAFALAGAGREVGLLDIDICGPSAPKMLGLEGEEVHQSAMGWSPVYVEDNLAVMSIGFMLPNPDDAVIWRGPRWASWAASGAGGVVGLCASCVARRPAAARSRMTATLRGRVGAPAARRSAAPLPLAHARPEPIALARNHRPPAAKTR
jgi:hypothetical protein